MASLGCGGAVHVKFGKIVKLNAVSAKVATVAAAIDKETGNISYVLEELKNEGRGGIDSYLTAGGDPNIDTTAKAIKLLDNLGAASLSLGNLPCLTLWLMALSFRQPLQGHSRMAQLWTLWLPQIKAPVVLFVYYNQLLRRGVEVFVKEAKAAGASGLVVPDLPLEETDRLRQLTAATGLELVLLTTPTTPAERMISITEASQGFVYLVSLTGVTGTRSKVEARVEKLLKSIKAITEKAVCVGFGISNGPQALQIAEWVHWHYSIGSAVVKLLGESGTPEQGLQAVERIYIRC
ncbi:hypothetical protein R1flu_020308 [Riccia fluitans]|uniref:tryptophan synthase n=1 Tax=Riccia fluitans TaxID=41844 RepID=A0ABD1ZLI9_9MARC